MLIKLQCFVVYDYSQTPLHCAAEHDQLEVVRVLLHRGALVDDKTDHG